MEWIEFQSAPLLVGILLSLVLAIVGTYLRHAILCDSLALGIVMATCLHSMLGLSPILCVLAGLAIFGITYCTHHTKLGFWLMNGWLSLLWSGILGSLAYGALGQDAGFAWTVFGLSFPAFAMLYMGKNLR